MSAGSIAWRYAGFRAKVKGLLISRFPRADGDQSSLASIGSGILLLVKVKQCGKRTILFVKKPRSATLNAAEEFLLQGQKRLSVGIYGTPTGRAQAKDGRSSHRCCPPLYSVEGIRWDRDFGDLDDVRS